MVKSVIGGFQKNTNKKKYDDDFEFKKNRKKDDIKSKRKDKIKRKSSQFDDKEDFLIDEKEEEYEDDY